VAEPLEAAPLGHQLVTVYAAAEAVGLAPITIWRYLAEGRLRRYRLQTRRGRKGAPPTLVDLEALIALLVETRRGDLSGLAHG